MSAILSTLVPSLKAGYGETGGGRGQRQAVDPWKLIGQLAKPTRRSSGLTRDPDSNKRWNVAKEWHPNCFLTSTCKRVHTLKKDGEVEKEMREGEKREREQEGRQKIGEG